MHSSFQELRFGDPARMGSSRLVWESSRGNAAARREAKGNQPQLGFPKEESWQRETDGEALTSRAKRSEGTRRSRSGSAPLRGVSAVCIPLAPYKSIWAPEASRDEDVSPSPASSANFTPSGRSLQPLVLVTPPAARQRRHAAFLQSYRVAEISLFCFSFGHSVALPKLGKNYEVARGGEKKKNTPNQHRLDKCINNLCSSGVDHAPERKKGEDRRREEIKNVKN